MTGGSTVPHRQLGRRLRELRNQARLTVRAAASTLEWSEAKLWRIETGRTSLRGLDVEAMCRVYGAPQRLAEGLMALAKETRAGGWWHSYGDALLEGFDLYRGLEDAASRLCWYAAELVPGLLQTEAYARAVIRPAGGSEEEVERRVHARLASQALLTRATAPPTVRVALGEAVLHRPVGGREVMAGQLGRLMELTDHPDVSIRVIPFAAGPHPGLQCGPFVLMRFPVTGDGRETEPPTVCAEGLTGALYLDKPPEIADYDAAFTTIWTTAAGEARSRGLLHEARREFAR